MGNYYFIYVLRSLKDGKKTGSMKVQILFDRVNCGVNGTRLFNKNGDYEHFLRLYDRYIESIAETFAWCLLGNHFHLLVRIKKDVVYKYSNADRSIDADRFEMVKWETVQAPNLSASAGSDSVAIPGNVKTPKPHLHFSHLFNAYAKYFNKRYSRHGSLFERPFRRKQVDTAYYLKQVILYIHNNPVHHGFVEHTMDYPWSSYLSCVSVKPTKLQRGKVIGWFDDIGNFKYYHNKKLKVEKIEKWLDL